MCTNNLDPEARHIAAYHRNSESIALIAVNDSKHTNRRSQKGFIHAGICRMGETMIGHIFMLFAESNEIACRLVTEVEAWFKQRNITQIFAFWWPANPYNFILHGRETNGRAGAFPANNALRRLDYDLLNDIMVMQLKMADEPKVFIPEPELHGLEIRQIPLDNNELAWSSRLEAHRNGRKVGHCEMYNLLAISQHFRKRIGQITIDTDSSVHGTGVAKSLLTYAHRELYRQGARSVMLATGQALFRAIKFYRNLGYEAELIRAYSYVKEIQ